LGVKAGLERRGLNRCLKKRGKTCETGINGAAVDWIRVKADLENMGQMQRNWRMLASKGTVVRNETRRAGAFGRLVIR
jgi:hypothetical protein